MISSIYDVISIGKDENRREYNSICLKNYCILFYALYSLFLSLIYFLLFFTLWRKVWTNARERKKKSESLSCLTASDKLDAVVMAVEAFFPQPRNEIERESSSAGERSTAQFQASKMSVTRRTSERVVNRANGATRLGSSGKFGFFSLREPWTKAQLLLDRQNFSVKFCPLSVVTFSRIFAYALGVRKENRLFAREASERAQ